MHWNAAILQRVEHIRGPDRNGIPLDVSGKNSTHRDRGHILRADGAEHARLNGEDEGNDSRIGCGEQACLGVVLPTGFWGAGGAPVAGLVDG